MCVFFWYMTIMYTYLFTRQPENYMRERRTKREKCKKEKNIIMFELMLPCDFSEAIVVQQSNIPFYYIYMNGTLATWVTVDASDRLTSGNNGEQYEIIIRENFFEKKTMTLEYKLKNFMILCSETVVVVRRGKFLVFLCSDYHFICIFCYVSYFRW